MEILGLELIDGLRSPVLDDAIGAQQAAAMEHFLADTDLPWLICAHQLYGRGAVVSEFHSATIAHLDPPASSMSNSSRLTLVAPGVGAVLLRSKAADGVPAVLSRLAGRGSVKRRWALESDSPLRAWQRGLLDTLGVSAESFASAPVCAAGDATEAVTEYAYWLHARPVHFAAGLDRLTFMDLEGAAQITDAEHAELTRALHPHFPTQGFTLHATADQWFVACERPLQATMFSPDALLTADLQTLMPRGPDAAQLRRLMTEIQMVLHEHPVNVARERRGLPAINALWLWGGGTIPPARVQPLPAAYANDSFTRGLYRLRGHDVQPVPNDMASWSVALPRQWSVVVAAVSDIDRLEAAWLVPLSQALRTGSIAQVDLILDDWHVQADRAALRRFWRRPLAPAQWGHRS